MGTQERNVCMADYEPNSAELDLLKTAEEKGGWERIKIFTRLSGPGWLQGAITLGGGSLAGSLYLGVLAGYSLLWLQPIAMILGIVMLSAITYVTLSTGKRPLQAINEHINPVLGWGWAVATLMANIVWCLPQFSLGTAAIQQNLIPSLGTPGGKWVASLGLLLVAGVIVYFYDSGKKGIKIFEVILKIMVGIVVVCFFGVVIKLTFSEGGLAWGSILGGFMPNLKLLSEPSAQFQSYLQATGEHAGFWKDTIVGVQRDVMITAVATAVGINMTFLLPYSMLRKGWGRTHRGLAIYDLAIGLFFPFVLATSCVVIAAASQFHTKPQAGVIEGTAPAGMIGQYQALLSKRLTLELGANRIEELSQDKEQLRVALESLPQADKEIAAMLVKRDAGNLAEALKPLTGERFSHTIFGLGVLGMALSTIIILMLISGFTICEMAGWPHSGWHHRLGCFVAGLGVLGPFIYTGKTQFWLAVPTSVFGMTLLPIAYLSFFLLLNNRGLMKADISMKGHRTWFNGLMGVALLFSTVGAAWSIWTKVKWVGVTIVGCYFLLALIVHFIRPPRKVS